MILYGAPISPFVRKVALVLAEKGLTYEPARGGRGSGGPEFAAASPFGKIPAINDDGFTLSDSTAIVCYLDAQYPEPRLIPADARAYGKAIWFDEFSDTIFAASGLKIMFNRLVGPKLMKVGGDEALALQGDAEMPPLLDYVEEVAPASGWLLGEDFSIADISVASMLRTMSFVGHPIDAAARPRTATWFERVAARPSWQAIIAPEDAYWRKIMPAE